MLSQNHRSLQPDSAIHVLNEINTDTSCSAIEDEVPPGGAIEVRAMSNKNNMTELTKKRVNRDDLEKQNAIAEAELFEIDLPTTAPEEM